MTPAVPIPVPSGAAEQIAAAIEAAAGLDALNDLSAAERDDVELDEQQQYAQQHAGIVRSWPTTAPAEPPEPTEASIVAVFVAAGMTEAAAAASARGYGLARSIAAVALQRGWVRGREDAQAKPGPGVEANLVDLDTRAQDRAAGRPHRIDLAPVIDTAHPEHRALRLAALNAGSVSDITELAVTGDVAALVVPAFPAPDPVPGKATRLTFTLTCALPRPGALERRDDVIAHLRALGIRLSMQQGPDTALADAGVPTIGDVLTGGGPQ